MLKLIKSELQPVTEQRLIRMRNDVVALRELPATELRAGYDTLEALRDTLSEMLDKVDGKDV